MIDLIHIKEVLEMYLHEHPDTNTPEAVDSCKEFIATINYTLASYLCNKP